MPILPIDTGRYGNPEMMKIFDEKNKLQRILDVEAALAWAHAQVGDIPEKSAKRIMQKASTKYVTVKRVKKVEREIKHDVMAVIRVLSWVSGPSGAYVHLGATSNDITDTALALQLKSAINLIERRLSELEKVLMLQAEK
ncbi:MAG TPA: lyase family protein, partial [archaeon]|nr:lyase family protein [archaeon]